MSISEGLPEPGVGVRHHGHATVDISLTLTAVCQDCGTARTRRFTGLDEAHQLMQDIGPWADQHADTPHSATPAA